MNYVNVKEIAQLGVDIEISENSGLSYVNAKEIIKIVIEKGKHITIDAKPYSYVNIKEMIKIGADNITIRI